jgi:hypothetical protein
VDGIEASFPRHQGSEKKDVGFYGPASRDPYEGYYCSSRAGVIPQKFRDNRFHPKTYIVSIVLGSGTSDKNNAKVYPFADLNRAGVVNESFAGRELLVSYCESVKSRVVFGRRMGDKLLTFEINGKNGSNPEMRGAKGGCRLMRDRETGSRWVLLMGEAIEGPLKGKRLEKNHKHLVLLVRVEGLLSKKRHLSP